jgi:3-carboxy-cis,cis-muconate cycloisomerase
MAHFHMDGVLFKDVYGTPEMRDIFSEEQFIQRFLDVEAALARAEADVGLIPQSAAAEITEKATLDHVDFDDIEANVAEMHLFSMAIIDAWKDSMDEAGEYVHWGATTQDIFDTALVLQMRDGLDVIERDLDAVAEALEVLADRYAETPMMGRTHQVHALPITFGMKAATWLDEVNRNRERVAAMRERVEVVEFFGAVGTLSSLGEDGLAVQEALGEELGLAVPDVAWYATRDRIAEVVSTLAMSTATLARIGKNVLLMNREEFGEVSEPFEEGEIGSSTMPHKRNPVRSEETALLSRLLRGRVGTAMELMEGYDERDFSMTLGEAALVPEAFCYTSRALAYIHEVVSGLVVHEDAMLANLHHHGGVVVSEAVMMAVAEGMGRQTAHDVVHEAAMEALDGDGSFADVLLADDRIAANFSRERIESLTDPEAYTGVAAQLARRTVERSRDR